MDVAVIKYNAGNVQSVLYAMERLGVNATLTDDWETIKKADKVIFPGQGEASTAMRYLKERKIDQLIKELTQPFFGICLGLQLLCEHSEEYDTQCLGVFPIKVKKFPPLNKVPHMGWNNLENLKSPLLEGLDESSYVYYVHSYYAEIDPKYTIASSHYINDFSAILHKDNYYAMQGHPEKSSVTGEKILNNFLKL
ncbi:imidazole glycerol phosphate synthase subunit HisH [Cyclobacterium amurskyense]|uniref:Imidazole glycerol phosphate synthase subunit HisH n=1 Tax=Cyclobacterium amurskyense TaxID=320787 RepID=A0A0H4PCZ2_9BACT|nr:imidazole glycerol phosphate synthase subunit HisH [Cyclobacterium amurskyense]AKP52109.1 Imidazole glycerol phosphate synthase subunit HisH [Cyclobacterium amurskyense]|tara:strand:- start:45638 stop:46222 length:585 start_codon:yes stop_codon:yes gene_type:complete